MEILVARECIFCRGAAGNTEHIVPLWYSREVPSQSVRVAHSYLNIETTESRVWNTPANVDFRSKHVCALCNQGWMSNLEDAAKTYIGPMARGERCEISNLEHPIIGRWAVKTAIMACTMRSAANRIVRRHAHQLYDTRNDYAAPLPAVMIRLFGCDNTQGEVLIVSHELELSSDEESPPSEGIAVVMAFGCLILQVVLADPEQVATINYVQPANLGGIPICPGGPLVRLFPPMEQLVGTADSLMALTEDMV